MQPISFLQRQRGFSIVELLIGVAVGLFILGGALKLFGDYINNNRRLVMETRVNQDMRAAADLIARDLRRAGYWGNSIAGVVTTNNMPVALASPYAEIVDPSLSLDQITYKYAQNTGTEENFGFKLDPVLKVLQYPKGITWQALTDPSTLIITNFTLTPKHKCVALQQYCTGGSSSSCAACTALLDPNGCPSATATVACATCPFIKVRSYDIALQGKSTADASVVRSIQETVRTRNDQLLGSCPL